MAEKGMRNKKKGTEHKEACKYTSINSLNISDKEI
jgi:hypothetical protein